MMFFFEPSNGNCSLSKYLSYGTEAGLEQILVVHFLDFKFNNFHRWRTIWAQDASKVSFSSKKLPEYIFDLKTCMKVVKFERA